MVDLVHKWPIAASWEAAVEVTAAAYGVAPELLRAESRGRGPRPPRALWLPKKMAVHVAVILADCEYADLGRAVGLHRDTIASHCASLREICAEDESVETASEMLVAAGVFRLDAVGARQSLRARARPMLAPIAGLGGQLAALEEYMRRVLDTARARVG